ncbi:unnamed protein product [Cyclocybe aegerita]|uniref:Fungal-type protein kinase domain-containing protein n=1 Tax=Cyclocybe aegerita TaxID=1973307 RepID=A0A8S0WT17_CYCAE|nr:unnamed protein product [Cyclocybe aegerita]
MSPVTTVAQASHTQQGTKLTKPILQCPQRGLTEFESCIELLIALRDAIAGHQHLLREGILHRDVNVNTILIAESYTDGKTDSRGILIDLDKTSCANEDPTYSRPHSHLDDLESFFHVLCWICFAYMRPRQRVSETPYILADWNSKSVGRACRAKKAFFADPLGPQKTDAVSDFFCAPFRKLLQNLHGFFRPYAFAPLQPPPPLSEILSTANEDYETILAMFEEAIREVGALPQP